MMINKKLVLLLGVVALLFTSCGGDDDETLYGNWKKGFNFGGTKRDNAVAFVINDKAYIGLGYNGNMDVGKQYLSDFMAYGGGTSWENMDNFPGELRKGAAAFAIGSKGYMFGGKNDESSSAQYYGDLWEFDPAAGEGRQWTKITDAFPGAARADATAFVVGEVAYIVGGESDNAADIYKDCWKFSPADNSFTEVANIGMNRAGAFAFVINGKAYIGGGYDNGLVSEFEIFDPEKEEWNEGKTAPTLRPLYLSTSWTDDIDHYDNVLDLRRKYTSVFVMDDKGYIAGGQGSGILSDCWEYDPTTDLWTQKNSFQSNMLGRRSAVAFMLKETPYVTTGYSGSYLSDLWIFEPNAEADDKD